LPTTIPSDWNDVSSGTHGAVVVGRGWGHGVGMVQWGAHGKAK
jgi:peptidoglycan hydrolase-like amidase